MQIFALQNVLKVVFMQILTAQDASLNALTKNVNMTEMIALVHLDAIMQLQVKNFVEELMIHVLLKNAGLKKVNVGTAL